MDESKEKMQWEPLLVLTLLDHHKMKWCLKKGDVCRKQKDGAESRNTTEEESIGLGQDESRFGGYEVHIIKKLIWFLYKEKQ